MKTSFQDDDQAVPQVKYATSADYFIAKTTDVKEAAPVLVSRHSMQNVTGSLVHKLFQEISSESCLSSWMLVANYCP